MITIDGTAKLRVSFSVEVDMTVEQWDSLSERKQNEIIEGLVDWMDECRSGEVDDIEVDDVLEDGVSV